MRNAVRLALTALAVAAASLCLVGAAGAAEPKMKIDPRLRVSTVCFPVTDPLGLPRTLYGKRYTTPTATSSTPAIVLVHGIASSTANWDFSPSWSTARALATAGYVVYSYDRLGYARSSYFDVPGGGETLTTREHRRMLHEVVGSRRRSQVPQPIKPNSRAHAAAHFRFRFAIAVSYARREVGVAQPDIHRASSYVLRLDRGARPRRQRSMDIDVVLRCHLGKRFVSRLAHLQDELFEASRRAEQQHAHWRVALDAETMRDVAWPEDKCAGASQRPFAVAHERHLAFQDVPRFILQTMSVVWRSEPRPHRQMLDQSERAVGRLRGRSDDGWQPEKGDRRLGRRAEVWLQVLWNHRLLLVDGDRRRARLSSYNHHV